MPSRPKLDLTDRAAVNARVAKAMGWRHIKAQARYPAGAGNYAGAMATVAKWYRVRPDGGLEESVECPDHLSDDPALNAEMWKALPRTGKTWKWVRWHWRRDDVVVWVVKGFGDGAGPPETFVKKIAYTEAEALVRALEAAGLLKEDDE